MANDRSVRARAGGIAIVLAVLAVLAMVIARAPRESAPSAPSAAVPPPAPIVRASVPELEAEPIAPAPSPVPPPGSSAPPRALASDDPCAPDHDDAPVSRPSMVAVLDARQGELAARFAALGPGASSELREGLRATAAREDPERAIALLTVAPDRAAHGFDHASAAALYVALTAMNEGRAADARRWAARATALDRSDPAGPVLASILADQAADRAASTDALVEAFARDPEDPAIAWQLAMRLARGDSVAPALRALDAYLEWIPEDAAARRMRGRLARRAEAIEGTVSRARRGIVVRAADVADADRVLAIVDEALTDAARWTATARPSELLVIVHRDRDSMRRATCAPSWSGAMFDGVLHTDRETLAHDTVARGTLRHESLHAQLHAERRTVLPYWLDEGLAQRFAGEEGPDHHRSWAMLVRGGMIIPFESVEGPFVEIDDPRDARLAYHQSLAIVRYLEARHGAGAIPDAIARADRGVAPEALLGAIAPELDRARFLAFLAELE